MNTKQLFFTVLFVFTCLFANAQTATNESNRLIIANQDVNVLYRGYDNRLSIEVPGVPTSELVVKSENATFEFKDGTWFCRVTDDVKDVNINVYAKDGKTSYGTMSFGVRILQDPVACIKLANGELWTADKGGLEKSQFEGATVVISYGTEPLNAPFTVTKFNLTLFDNQGNCVKKPSDGNKFTEGQLKLIKNLKSGTIISLSNIEFTGAKSGKNMPFAPIVLK